MNGDQSSHEVRFKGPLTLYVGKDVDFALRRFKRMVERDGILRELRIKNRSHKKSDRRKIKSHQATERRIRSERRKITFGSKGGDQHARLGYPVREDTSSGIG